MLYLGKQLFYESVDNPSLLAQTVLGIMLIFLKRGPTFLIRLIPISKLTSAFLVEQTELTVQAITFVLTNASKVGNLSQGWPGGSFFNSYYIRISLISGLHWVVGEGATPLPGLLNFTLDPYFIVLSDKQSGI